MIILLGFPKSGTTSFQNLFTQLGYNSAHWRYGSKYIGDIVKNNKENNILLLTGLDNIDCITQLDICISYENNYWPQISDYEQLYNENKESIFILNVRDPCKILSSFKRWCDKSGNNCYLERIVKYNWELLKPCEKSDNIDNCFINLVKRHYTNVEIFFSNQKDSKFVVYDIENDKLDKLGKYINLKGIRDFPHRNKNKRK